jgi:fluoride ion exporter CrcB/FEX
MTPVVLVATVLLGAVGAALRWLISRGLPSAPWWSLGVVNATGSALAGAVMALPETFWTFPLVAGLAGGLTTLSTLAILMTPETTEGIARKVLWPLTLHLLLGIGTCAAGFVLVTLLL